jgi:hypothetical protein
VWKGGILMKKHNLLIIVLIIILLFGAYNFFSLKQRESFVNELFMANLSEVQAGFASDYSKLNENDKIFNYMKASSNLHTAVSILDSTSYADIENHIELSNALNELYFYMTNFDTVNSRWKDVGKKSELINKYLHYIITDPNDKKSCNELSRLANNLSLGVEDVLINYEGNSENWHVDYKIDGNEHSHNTYYTFKYTGKDGSLVKRVKYSIDTRNEGEEGEFSMDKTKVYTGKLKIPSGFPKATDRDMLVKLEWNGKKESLILNKSK